MKNVQLNIVGKRGLNIVLIAKVSSLGSRTVFNAVLAIVSAWTIVASLAVPIWMAHHLKVSGKILIIEKRGFTR